MAKISQSSLPGLPYPSFRDDSRLKTGQGFVNGFRKMNKEPQDLWRIRDKLYDLKNWEKSHPGGAEWIKLTKGTDITVAFEVHHINETAERLLPKFYIRDATTPKLLPYTFEPDGFYWKFKERAREALKNVDFHRPSVKSKLIADSLAFAMLVSNLVAASTESWIAILIGSLFFTGTCLVSHNFLHMRNNFRMYYIDITLFSSKEWRMTHVLNHHLYTNTIWDYEIYSLEPFLNYLPRKNKPLTSKFLGYLTFPIICSVMIVVVIIQRCYSIFYQWGGPEFRDAFPFFLPLAMCFTASTPGIAFRIWFTVVIISSFLFYVIGLTAAHHHPDIFHDGDICRNNLDWGLLAIDAVRDREVIDEYIFFALMTFGSHTLHHLLPTVDHAYLPLCLPAFQQTCKEFGVDHGNWTAWDLFKGQFQQLKRIEPKENKR